MALTRIHVEIGEVVLHGVSAADRRRVEDGLRARLEHVLAEAASRQALRSNATLDRLVLPAISGSVRSEQLGAAVADALAAGLAHPAAGPASLPQRQTGATSLARPAIGSAAAPGSASAGETT